MSATSSLDSNEWVKILPESRIQEVDEELENLQNEAGQLNNMDSPPEYSSNFAEVDSEGNVYYKSDLVSPDFDDDMSSVGSKISNASSGIDVIGDADCVNFEPIISCSSSYESEFDFFSPPSIEELHPDILEHEITQEVSHNFDNSNEPSPTIRIHNFLFRLTDFQDALKALLLILAAFCIIDSLPYILIKTKYEHSKIKYEHSKQMLSDEILSVRKLHHDFLDCMEHAVLSSDNKLSEIKACLHMVDMKSKSDADSKQDVTDCENEGPNAIKSHSSSCKLPNALKSDSQILKTEADFFKVEPFDSIKNTEKKLQYLKSENEELKSRLYDNLQKLILKSLTEAEDLKFEPSESVKSAQEKLENLKLENEELKLRLNNKEKEIVDVKQQIKVLEDKITKLKNTLRKNIFPSYKSNNNYSDPEEENLRDDDTSKKINGLKHYMDSIIKENENFIKFLTNLYFIDRDGDHTEENINKGNSKTSEKISESSLNFNSINKENSINFKDNFNFIYTGVINIFLKWKELLDKLNESIFNYKVFENADCSWSKEFKNSFSNIHKAISDVWENLKQKEFKSYLDDSEIAFKKVSEAAHSVVTGANEFAEKVKSHISSEKYLERFNSQVKGIFDSFGEKWTKTKQSWSEEVNNIFYGERKDKDENQNKKEQKELKKTTDSDTNLPADQEKPIQTFFSNNWMFRRAEQRKEFRKISTGYGNEWFARRARGRSLLRQN